ncbi:hypothetical protein T484DRAFT_1895215, partial [Baffinella frigidus]
MPLAEELQNQDAIIAAACDVRQNAADPLGDGDQSLLRCTATTGTTPGGPSPEASSLHAVWCNLGDFVKNGRLNVGGIARAAYWGDAAYIQQPSGLYGAPKPLGSLTELLEVRHTNLRLTALHCAVLGAKRREPQASIPPDWVKCASLLIKAGARVDSRDLLGHTPMMGACMAPYHNADSLAIALHLAKHGATGRDLNRLGMNVLMIAVEKQAIDVVHVLVEADCDPRQTTHWGQTALQVAKIMRLMPGGGGPSLEAITKTLEAACERLVSKNCKSSALSGRAVVLKGLSDAGLNGQKGQEVLRDALRHQAGGGHQVAEPDPARRRGGQGRRPGGEACGAARTLGRRAQRPPWHVPGVGRGRGAVGGGFGG